MSTLDLLRAENARDKEACIQLSGELAALTTSKQNELSVFDEEMQVLNSLVVSSNTDDFFEFPSLGK